MENRKHKEWRPWDKALLLRASLQSIDRSIQKVSRLPNTCKSCHDLGKCISESPAYFYDPAQQSEIGGFLVESDPVSGVAQASR